MYPRPPCYAGPCACLQLVVLDFQTMEQRMDDNICKIRSQLQSIVHYQVREDELQATSSPQDIHNWDGAFVGFVSGQCAKDARDQATLGLLCDLQVIRGGFCRGVTPV